MNKVSVIIPTFRRPQYIEEAIKSVLSQTENDIEIIVVDDNGLNTEDQKANYEKLRPYILTDEITYIAHEVNKNGAVARNTGIKHSQSQYIAFLDDDDLFEPHKIQMQIEKLVETNADLCLCGFTRWFPDKKVYAVPKQDEVKFENIMRHTVDTCAGSCLLVKSELVKDVNGFDETFERQQDLEFLIRLLQKGKIAVIDDSLVTIRMHSQNMSIPNLKRTISQRTHFLEKFEHQISDLDDDTRAKIYDTQYIEIMKVALKNKNVFSAIKWCCKTSHPCRTFVDICGITKKYIIGRH